MATDKQNRVEPKELLQRGLIKELSIMDYAPDQEEVNAALGLDEQGQLRAPERQPMPLGPQPAWGVSRGFTT